MNISKIFILELSISLLYNKSVKFLKKTTYNNLGRLGQ